MRKHIKNSSKRKWVVGGVAFFGAVALLTTGFASWVVGLNQYQQWPTVGVTVDTVKDASVIFTMNTDSSDNSITVSEGTSSTASENNYTSGKILNYENAPQADWTAKFTWSLTMGEDYVISNGHQPNAIKFTIASKNGSEAAVNGWNSVAAGAAILEDTDLSDGSVGDGHVEGGTYISLYDPTDGVEKHVDSYVVKFTPTSGGSTNLTEQSATVTFTWGSFFDYKAPTAYYNALNYTDASSSQADVLAEMNAFSTALTGSSVTLLAELTYVA